MTAVAATAASGDSDSNCSKQQLQQAVTMIVASSDSNCSKR